MLHEYSARINHALLPQTNIVETDRNGILFDYAIDRSSARTVPVPRKEDSRQHHSTAMEAEKRTRADFQFAPREAILSLGVSAGLLERRLVDLPGWEAMFA